MCPRLLQLLISLNSYLTPLKGPTSKNAPVVVAKSLYHHTTSSSFPPYVNFGRGFGGRMPRPIFDDELRHASIGCASEGCQVERLLLRCRSPRPHRIMADPLVSISQNRRARGRGRERVRKRERGSKQVCMWTAAISKLPVPPRHNVPYRATSAHFVAACATRRRVERLLGLTVTCSPRQREEFIGWMSFLDPPWTCPGSIIGFNRLQIIPWSALPASRHEARKPAV